MQHDLHYRQRVKPCAHIIYYDAKAFGKMLKLTHRRRFHNIESSEKYKSQQQGFPCDRRRDQSDQLARDFVNHHELRIFQAAGARDLGRRWNAHCHRQSRQAKCG